MYAQKKTFPEILRHWCNIHPESVLCQRDLKTDISFTPVWIENYYSDQITFWISKNYEKQLTLSKNFYKTITIINHNSTKSNPNLNKGFFIVGSVINWSQQIPPKSIPTENLWKGVKNFLLVTLELYILIFFSGIRFGSYSWKKIPLDSYKGYQKFHSLPTWKNSKVISEKEQRTLLLGHFLYIAVITKQGTIHVTPVHFVAIRNRVYLATSFLSAKMRGYKTSQIAAGYTYLTNKGYSEFDTAVTIYGSSFAYGWNFLSAIIYGNIFGPYLAFIAIQMMRKYPKTIKNFPTKQTNIHWRFMPLVARTFLEIYWQKK